MCTCAKCSKRCNSLSLERWRELILGGVNPFHFYQLQSVQMPTRRECSSLVHEYLYQSGGKQVGRQEIREAIARAEALLAEQLGYWPAPTWQCEDIPWPHTASGNLRLAGRKIDVIGKPRDTFIANLDVQFEDVDHDGVEERFYVEVALADLPTTININELSLFISEADRTVPDRTFCDYEIRPLVHKVSGGWLFISGAAWLVMRPERYEGFAPKGANQTHWFDIDNPTNYVATLALYHRSTDHVAGANGVWQARSGCNCVNTVQSVPGACAHCEATDFSLIDGVTGIVRPLKTFCQCGGRPNRLNISYRGGACLADWETTIARLATAELAGRACECGDDGLAYWREDLAMESVEKGTRFNRELLNNPWGTRRGHIYAWERVLDNLLNEGVAFL